MDGVGDETDMDAETTAYSNHPRTKRTLAETSINSQISDSTLEVSSPSNQGVPHTTRGSTKLPAPVLICDVSTGKPTQSDRVRLETEIEKHCSDIGVNRVQFTDAGNVLIFLKSQQDVDNLLKIDDLFPDCKRIELTNSTPKSHLLVIRGISKNSIQQYNSDPLRQLGVIEIREMTNSKSGKQMNLTKLFFDSKENRDKALAEKFIKIGYSRYIVEEFGKVPKQCHKCKKFGHLAAVCESLVTLCSKCGNEHDSAQCESVPKCVNCGGEHSAYWRGCDAYKQARIERLDSSQKPSNLRPTISSYRNYSAAVSKSAPNVELSEHIASTIKSSIEQQFKLLMAPFISRIEVAEEQITSLKNELSDMRDSIDAKVKAVLNENNESCALFFLDIFKLLAPVPAKKERSVISSIVTLFSSYSLGALDPKKVETKLSEWVKPIIHTTVLSSSKSSANLSDQNSSANGKTTRSNGPNKP